MKCIGPECDREARYPRLGLCQPHYVQTRTKGFLTPLRRYRKRPEAPDGYAFCNVCQTFKKEAEFYETVDGKTRPLCKTCHNEQTYSIAKEKQHTA